MLSNINKVKNILSKLIIANKCFKKVLTVKKIKICSIILELLQKEGYIYGYSSFGNFYSVFLKYSDKINCGLNKVVFINKKITFKNLNTFERNSLYLIFDKKGFSIDKISRKKVGYHIIIRF